MTGRLRTFGAIVLKGSIAGQLFLAAGLGWGMLVAESPEEALKRATLIVQGTLTNLQTHGTAGAPGSPLLVRRGTIRMDRMIKGEAPENGLSFIGESPSEGPSPLTLGDLGFTTHHERTRLVVTAIQPFSQASLAGFKKQDVIRAVKGTVITTANGFQETLQLYARGSKVKVPVWRGTLGVTLILQLEKMEVKTGGSRPVLSRDAITRIADQLVANDPELKGIPMIIQWQDEFEEITEAGRRKVPAAWRLSFGPLPGGGKRATFVGFRLDPQTGAVIHRSKGGPQ